MTQDVVWYFVDLLGTRQGPVSRRGLLDAIDQGRLRPASLVWRSGMPQWQPLSSLTDELGPAVDRAPPEPPRPVHSQPQYGTAHVVDAGFLRRAAAYVVDSLIYVVICIALGAVLGVALALGHASKHGSGTVVLIYTLASLIGLLYWPLQESSRHQATLGKRALGIKVTDLDGQRISFGRAFGRWLGKFLSGLIFHVGYMMAGFTKRKQALHDMLAGTRVVDRWAYTAYPQRQKQGTSAGGVLLALILMLVAPVAILAAIAIPAYQNYLARSQVAGALLQAATIQAQIAQSHALLGRCPGNADAGFRSAAGYADRYIQGIAVGSDTQSDRCAIQITLAGNSPIWPANASGWSSPCTRASPGDAIPMSTRATCRRAATARNYRYQNHRRHIARYARAARSDNPPRRRPGYLTR
jgi:uncharacterized RDD family membrane protein YckC/Tfp pilus assembly major pilin PilA